MSNAVLSYSKGEKSLWGDALLPPVFCDTALLSRDMLGTVLPDAFANRERLSAVLSARVRIAGHMSESIVDGPGLRYVLFTQGCPHHCAGCHNPDTHDFEAGEEVSLYDVYQQIRRNPLLRGVTFSGGEPLCQCSALLPLAEVLKKQGYHLMAYTGFTFEQLLAQNDCQSFLACLDILVDGPFIQAEKSLELRFRGSCNQRVLDVPESMRLEKPVLHMLHR